VPRAQAPADRLATVWLPTAAGRPVASHPLIAEPPAPGTDATLAAWSIPAVPLDPATAIDFLSACLDRETLAPGVAIGTTLHYWAAAFRLAAGLVARERFLPDVAEEGKHWVARWRPLVAGPDRRRVAQLAAAMPPACRAFDTGVDAPPARPAAVVLAEFLDGVVDALVRTAAGGSSPARGKSVHGHWLAALRSADGTIHGSAAELAQLAEQVRDWRQPLAAADAAFRLCFRLEEPADADTDAETVSARGTWTVRYLLQAEDDPSLLVPLADAWNPKGKAARLRDRGLPAREVLLAALGRAARLSPDVDRSLKAAAPVGFAADTPAAHRFLTETAWLLEQAGFGVLLPAWWARTGGKYRPAVTAHVKGSKKFATANGVMSLDEVVKFDWKASLGDTEVSLQELEALARLKAPLVKVRGRWVQVNADEIRAALDFWKTHPHSQATLRDVVKMAVGAGDGPAGFAVRGVKATGGVKQLLDQLQGTAAYAELPPPAGFAGTLRPYQVRGYSWLAFLRRWGLGACLADDMGLGKTPQTLALLQRDRERGETRPVLLACPMSVVGNWKKEAARFTPDLPVLVHHGQKRTKGTKFAAEVARYGLVLSSYPLLHRDAELFRSVRWAGVILDEAQNIKNPDAKQAQAARSLTADYRVALTGTPVENHVGDLWSVSQFLNPGFLGPRERFRRDFLVPIQVLHDAEAATRLKRLTAPFLLRRLKSDKSIIADLPDKQEAKVFCTLTKEQASLYAAVVAELDRTLKGEDGIRRKGLILGALSRLKQVCNHPAHFLADNSPIPGRSGKLERLTEMLDEVLQTADRALVFTQFTEMGEILRTHLQETFGREVPFLHGGVPRAQRDRMVARFQDTVAPDTPRVFLISLKAGGTGLNLTAATHVFHFDRWWNPAVEDQATDRAYRIGQTRAVQVHKFVCVGTLEEKIDEMIGRKKDVAGRVVGAGEGWLTELSDTELKDLLALRADGVGE
jgi:SNF2 family DNA or RNA helicase